MQFILEDTMLAPPRISVGLSRVTYWQAAFCVLSPQELLNGIAWDGLGVRPLNDRLIADVESVILAAPGLVREKIRALDGLACQGRPMVQIKRPLSIVMVPR